MPEATGKPPNPILAIVGVTGSGKNELAQEIALRTGATLVSIDSRKVYRGLDIGTAKPKPEIIREFEYGMIDCADPREYFSAGRYAREARELIAPRLASERPVIMVGGTGFYLDAFINGLAELPEVRPATRDRLQAEAAERGWDSLYADACDVDPEFMHGIPRGDKTRVRRVLETWFESGQRHSDLLKSQRLSPCPWPVCAVWPDIERGITNDRIERRVYKMRDAGLTAEVRGLLDQGISPDAPGLATVGYRELVDFLTGRISEDRAYQDIVINTRRYAKRQATWFRHRAYVQRICSYPVIPEKIIEVWTGSARAGILP